MFQSSLDFICFTAKKIPFLNSTTAVWISVLLAVALCLPETRLWNFETASSSVSAKISGFHSVAVGKKQVVWHYDASDTVYPLVGDVAKAAVEPLFGAPTVAFLTKIGAGALMGS